MKKICKVFSAIAIMLLMMAMPSAAFAAADEDDFQFSNGVITGYVGSGGDVEIPDQIGGIPVTTIDYYAFFECTSLKSVTIPASVTLIEEEAFGGCTALRTVTFLGEPEFRGFEIFWHVGYSDFGLINRCTLMLPESWECRDPLKGGEADWMGGKFNVKYSTSHVHSFTYSAENDMIKATCTEGCPYKYDEDPLTLQLIGPWDEKYDGFVKAIYFKSDEENLWKGADLAVPEIQYYDKQGSLLGGRQANVGKYDAKITVGDCTAVHPFEIKKCPVDVKWGQVEKKYPYIDGAEDFSDYTDITSISPVYVPPYHKVNNQPVEIDLSVSIAEPYNGAGEYTLVAAFAPDDSVAANYTLSPGTQTRKFTIVSDYYGAGVYTVTFNHNDYLDNNDGEDTTEDIDEKYGESFILPDEDPVRTDYTFLGWFTQRTGGTQITADTIVNIEDDTTLYAHWKYNYVAKIDNTKYTSLAAAIDAVEDEDIIGLLADCPDTVYVNKNIHFIIESMPGNAYYICNIKPGDGYNMRIVDVYPWADFYVTNMSLKAKAGNGGKVVGDPYPLYKGTSEIWANGDTVSYESYTRGLDGLCDFYAVPSDGYKFKNWTYSIDGVDMGELDDEFLFADDITGDIVFTANFVGNPEITVTAPPTKTTYTEGESFDPAGMEVTATYTNGTKKTVTDYEVSPAGALKPTDTFVTITYTEDGVPKTAKQAITVNALVLNGIEVTTPPTKTTYAEGESFDPTGMEVTATYDNGSPNTVTDYEISPAGALKPTDTFVTVTYTKDGVPKTAKQAITVNALPPTFPFTDVKTDRWSYDDIKFAFENGLMNGTSTTKFSPEMAASRGMIVTILFRMSGDSAVKGTMTFKDVKAGTWYTEGIRWASSKGIVNGYDKTKFGPDDSVTREQLAVILYRYAEYKKMNVSQRANLSKYSDSGKIANWAKDAVSWANAIGLVNGTDKKELLPQGVASREQVAAILHRFMTK